MQILRLEHECECRLRQHFIGENACRPICNFHSSGWAGGNPFRFSRRAMGEKRLCGDSPCIAWDSYSSGALLKTVQEITAVLQNRVDPQLPSHTVSVEASTSGAASTGGATNDQGLLKPWSCGYTCRWCDAACTRKQGHNFHSCYEHRNRR